MSKFDIFFVSHSACRPEIFTLIHSK